jgi:septum formation protein
VLKIVLASASIRRQELLERFVQKFKIIVSDFNEDLVLFQNDSSDYVMSLSYGKALNVAEKLKEPSIVIGCDTIVSFEGKILGKPEDYNEAFCMLKMLSGKKHQVYSGITLINTETKDSVTDYVLTEVKFSELSDEDIKKYIKSGEPMDKAGAYGIQGLAGVFVEEIHGCYYNVVGLPLNKLKKMLLGMGVNL